MLPPWFQAPLGARMVSRHFQFINSGGAFEVHLHLDSKDGRRVPTGCQTILTHARVSMMFVNPAPAIENVLWDDSNLVGWDIWSPQQGELTPRLPFAWNAATSDYASTRDLAEQNGIVATESPPLVAPIVLTEGHQAFVRGTVSATGDRIMVTGWVAGFVMPVVNDVPGNRRFFTEERRQ